MAPLQHPPANELPFGAPRPGLLEQGLCPSISDGPIQAHPFQSHYTRTNPAYLLCEFRVYINNRLKLSSWMFNWQLCVSKALILISSLNLTSRHGSPLRCEND